jgi:Glyoxalase-like domain
VETVQPDHIILGCRDLEEGINYCEKLSGYRAALGGSHPGRGTRNALLKLGTRSYLEILAPDPGQPELTWHKEITNLSEPLLIGWALPSKDLDVYAAKLRSEQVNFMGPTSGSRTRADGQTFRWKTLSFTDDKHGLLPFYIEWGADSLHPAQDAAGACLLTSFYRTGRIAEPLPSDLQLKVAPLHIEPAQLHAKISGLHGAFELLSVSIPSETWVNQ